MPLVYAMGAGPTELGPSVARAMELVKPFPKSSVTLFLCTDGDTVPVAEPLYAPPSIDRATVLGVGDTERGTFIDGHQSRQDVAVLQSIASALHAEYINVNDRHVPTAAMSGLVLPPGEAGWNLKLAAIRVMAMASAILAFIPVAQQYAGTGWRLHLPGAVRGAREERS
jgi:Ca-activated chloride channel family protein